ncbi:3D-(3,5/4)-trihydroxycyclohexane-1,2-dione acylhydrolase (decyclizing) [Enterococcus canintestini]|uniref:3D-(3,5/4)-trihydroxycyclohexane-1,2-dione hydrolase n=1 Tax=Enterococcus canintestini TaxID=317010 RepID=A0A267HTC6_9ENTE|nr:3D-(3,5/4)-trihydroxycyclohexane-1,2-dione acylhydrolase (decyclizing) [Enterococcus canintestini]PAB01594.1 3D-(3,5/4)-trihydroxycyclohexane-1,2-dione hydrolase [Enterococcus canintestini]
MSKTIPLTTAQALVKYLNQQFFMIDDQKLPFVKGIFHIFGHGNVLGLGQALAQDCGHLEIYQGKNEQGMGQAAVSFAKEKLRQQIFAVTTSVGPGAANLVTVAGTALANNLPVLLLPGDTFASRQPDPVLQQIEQLHSQKITTNDALKPLSRYWDRIERPEQLMSALTRAFEVLTNPVTAGPVTICLPQDVEGEVYDYPESFFKEKVHYYDRRPATERELSASVRLIENSQRPIIIVGGGAKYSEAGAVLERISKKHNIPLVETQSGKSTIVADFSLNFGGVGVTGSAPANRIIKEADLVIGVGTRYTDFTTASKTAFNTEHTKFLNINVSRMQGYKMDGISIVADAKTALLQIESVLDDLYQTQFGDLLTRVTNNWQTERIRLANLNYNNENFEMEIKNQFDDKKLANYAQQLKTNLTQAAVLIKLNQILPMNSIVVGAAGSLPGDMQRLWEAKSINSYNMEYGYSTMGYEIAGAYGAKIAHPEKEVFAFVGDGSFHMLHSELLSSIQYNKKINILLFDNSGYGCINNLQMGNGMPSFGTELTDYKNQVMCIDFAKLAEAYGAITYTVGNMSELETALTEISKSEQSTLIHIKVLPKTMTDSYDAWWNIGIAEITTDGSTDKVLIEKKEKLARALQY